MKRIFTLLVLFAAIQFSQAQYYMVPFLNAGTNPGGLNNDPEYPVGGGLVAGWATIHSGSKATPAWSVARTLPFAFNFNGQPFTKFRICSNGIVSFDTTAVLPLATYTRGPLPDANIPNNSICIWGLAGIGSNDNVVGKSFGVAPNRQYWIQFSSYGYGSVVSDGSNFCYWSIVLEETSGRIYIVDNRTGGYAATKQVSAGIQIDATTAIVVPKSPDLASVAGTDPTPADNTYYEFRTGTQPKFDMTATEITINPYIIVGKNAVTGTLLNNGSDAVTSFDLNYTVDGGATVTAAITGVNIAKSAKYSFSHPTEWTVDKPGVKKIEVWASNINGNPDGFPSDDYRNKTIVVYSRSIQKTPLYEIFTSSTCGPCVPGNINYHKIVDTKDQEEFVSIKYQQNFPGTGDPYCTTESINRRVNQYAINSIPRMEIDGGWDGNAQSFSEALYTSSRARAAGFEMSGTYKVDELAKTVTATIKYSPAFDATGYKLHVAINENETKMNVKSNGETDFRNVMKKMLPNETGTTLKAINDGALDSISFTYKFNGDYRLPLDAAAANMINHGIEHSVEEFGDLTVVAWIQGPDKVVQQALNLKSGSVGVKDLLSVKNIVTFPNPTTDQLNITLSAEKQDDILFTLVNADGKIVKSVKRQVSSGVNTVEINTTDLGTGLYYLSISDAKQNSNTRPIMISK